MAEPGKIRGASAYAAGHDMKFGPVFVVALLTGCSSHFSVGELAGKYVLSVDRGTDTIELSASGTYSHTYTAKSGNVSHQEDTWTLEELQAGLTVVLNNFHLLFKEDVGGRVLITTCLSRDRLAAYI